MEERVPKGRPKMNLDEVKLENLSKLGLTYMEIAKQMNCSYSYIQKHYGLKIHNWRK